MRGRIGDYLWAEVSDETLDIRAVVAALSDQLRGLVAGNVSWDSGVGQELGSFPEGWKVASGRVVCPPLDDAVLQAWPQSTCNDGRYDEWYFLHSEPPAVQLRAFCN